METLVEVTPNRKNAIRAYKKLINQKSKEQHDLKQQRKTKFFTGTRTVDPRTATWKVEANRAELKAMYEAYDLLRDKTKDTLGVKHSNNLIQKYIDLFNMNL